MSGPGTTEAGLPWALADALVQAQVEAQVLGEVANPVTLGRYRIDKPLGAGAMGQLLLAYDPDLQRHVALKLLSPALAGWDEGRERIVGEARAMAQLSDPHVAQVYEVDEADGQIFVAIEYIDGDDLQHWLDAETRSGDEVLAVFLQAGAGLAAAHDKGIVHRDFKPANVMLERDGRARVVDFGLARARPDAEPGESDALEVHLTRTGAVLGTPAYMAPELWDGADADARSDQFAFCVALVRGLTGRLPFHGSTAEEIRDSQADGIDASGFREMRGWIAQALRRGLDRDPTARWPDMHALLEVLDPVRRRRRAMAWGVAALVLTTSGVALSWRGDPCADAGAEIADVWSEGARERAVAAMSAADPGWGTQSGERLAARLDEHAEAWRSAARAVCRDDPGEAEPSRGCLRESKRRLTELVDEAVTGDASYELSAVAEAELLPDPRGCADAPPLHAYADDAAPLHANAGDAPEAEDAPPLHVYAGDAEDAEDARALLAEARHHLGVLSARSGAEAWVDAVAQGRTAAEAAVQAAETAGHEPLLARALWTAGKLQLRDGAAALAEKDLRRALIVAQQAADAPLAAAVVAELVYAVGRDRERFREAEDLADEGAAMIDALGDPPLLDAKLRGHRGSVLAHCRDCDRTRGVALQEEALALVVEVLGPHHPDSITALGNLGSTLSYADRHDEALVRLAEAIDAAKQTWGEDHPRTALLLGTRGLTLMRAGDFAAAEVDLRRSLEIRRARLGDTHVQVDDARYNLVLVLRRQKRWAEALPLLEAGLTNARRRLGEDDPRLGSWWSMAGETALSLHEDDKAQAYLQGAIRLFERTGGSADDYARARIALARAFVESDPTRARWLAERALLDAKEGGAKGRREDVEAFLGSL